MGVPLNVTEWMKGYVGLGAPDVDTGFMKGFEAETFFTQKIFLQIDDVDRFFGEPGHTAKVDGLIGCEAFGGKCRVTDGTFNMLVDPRNPDLKLMFYRLPFKNAEGIERTMLGHKTIKQSDPALEHFVQISRVSVRIYDGLVPGHDPDAKVDAPPPPALAMGQLYTETLDGFRSAHSFRSPQASPEDAARAIEKFGAFYMDKLWKVYAKTAPHPT